MKIGVGISSYNRPSALVACLAACMKHNKAGYRIFISDDGSTREHWELIAHNATLYNAEFKRRPNENIGLAGNCNRIIAHFEDCDYIGILMDDAMPIADAWISDHVYAHEQTSIAIYFCPDYGNPGKIYRTIPLDNGTTINIQQHTAGLFNFMHRSVWETIGGFEPRMRGVHFEDVEIMHRAARAGLAAGYTGNDTYPGTPSLAHITQLVTHQDVPACMPKEHLARKHTANFHVMQQSFLESAAGNLWRAYK